jgi:hypothetical protein
LKQLEVIGAIENEYHQGKCNYLLRVIVASIKSLMIGIGSRKFRRANGISDGDR